MAAKAIPAARRAPPFGKVEYQALTPGRWKDFEALFGERGACGGCWCMWWRLPRSEFDRGKGEKNRRAMKRIVTGGEVPGILAYARGEPVGWCAVAPRDRFPGLGRSRILAPVDDEPVWSIVCFFVAKAWRGKAITAGLIEAAVEHARKHGARWVEGYPIEPRAGRMADVFAFTGLASAFARAGFREVARRSETRPILRIEAGGQRRPRRPA
jgi:GNAT superfamily N-acetyltransferase